MPFSLPIPAQTIGLLLASNIFMTFACIGLGAFFIFHKWA
jgi:uncharacterized protein (DUF486 family)